MVIKEYPPIIKDGKTVVRGTTEQEINFSFTKQLEERGIESLNYFVNKKKYDEHGNDPEYQDEIHCGISWSPDFTSDDLMELVLQYADNNMTKQDMLYFGAQLQNYFIAAEEVEYDEDD